ncbi:hypothetical protein TH66_17665 [Carbonactinospora thermoautotrophica]|uniref:Uncharacterized protein n=1 Tax=Carbonactinospora thermoautotrophica TaxID=1469144 RepID=A0A132NJA1_9ACTN|nr:hypothetical protein TH66_17665 [Carbonactinospora thermoautotrophica]KWX10190.1 hypothetical protein TR74_05125 [Carbonactinospora thermoautotrophica]
MPWDESGRVLSPELLGQLDSAILAYLTGHPCENDSYAENEVIAVEHDENAYLHGVAGKDVG